MLAIINGHIKTMAGKEFAKGTILVENGKIVAIGDNIPLPPGAEVIDAAGNLVLPGFIDAHCHIGIFNESVGWEGEDGNEMTDPVTPHMRAIDGIYPEDQAFQDAREAGITTVGTGPGSGNVIGGEFVAMKTAGTVIDKMVLKTPTGLKCAFGENPKRVYGTQKKLPSTRMGTAAVMREALVKAQNYMKKLEKSKDDPEKEPERDLRLENLVKVLKKEIPLRAHAHRADDILTAIRIAEEFGVNIVIEHCTEGHRIIDELKAHNVAAVVGPSLSNRAKVELKDRTFKTPGILAKAGIKVAIMTDAPVIPIEYLPICAGLAVKHGMDEEEALKAITINAAEITGVADRVGSLEVGKDADIVIMDGSPFEIKSHVLYTIIDGKVVYQKE